MARGPYGPRVGVWGVSDVDDAAAVLLPRIVEQEMRRRLPDASIRVFAPFGRLRPRPRDGGRPAEPLGPATDERLAELGGALDLVVAGGPWCLAADAVLATLYDVDEEELAGRRLSRFFLGGPPPDADGLPVMVWHAMEVRDSNGAEARDDRRLWSALARQQRVSVRDERSRALLHSAEVEREVSVVPEAALLLPRLFSAALLRRRAEQSRVVSGHGAGIRILSVDADLLRGDTAGPVVAALAARREADDGIRFAVLDASGRGDIDAATDRRVVELTGQAVTPGRCTALEDVAATVAGSITVVARSRFIVAAAVGFGVPTVAIDDGESGLDELVGGHRSVSPHDAGGVRDAVANAVEAPERCRVRADPLVRRLDAEFDALAELARRAAGQRAATAATSVQVDVAVEDVAALIEAHRARGLRMVDERNALNAEIARLEVQLERREIEHRATVGKLEAEIAVWRSATERVVTSRTWRYTEGARRLYARLRHRLG